MSGLIGPPTMALLKQGVRAETKAERAAIRASSYETSSLGFCKSKLREATHWEHAKSCGNLATTRGIDRSYNQVLNERILSALEASATSTKSSIRNKANLRLIEAHLELKDIRDAQQAFANLDSKHQKKRFGRYASARKRLE